MEEVIYVWPCGTTCEPEYLEEYLQFMSDDYMVVPIEDYTLEDFT